MMPLKRPIAIPAAGAVLAAFLVGCSPTVKLQAPDEPIRFDVNVNITEQKRLEIDQEVLALLRQNPSLFGLKADEVPAAPSENEVK